MRGFFIKVRSLAALEMTVVVKKQHVSIPHPVISTRYEEKSYLDFRI
jgi:hypothetical protein